MRVASVLLLYRCGLFFADPLRRLEVIVMSKRKHRPNLNQARNMDVDAWRERQIRKRTELLIKEESRAFMLIHAEDTDEDLREYVRHQAKIRWRMPHPMELQGGLYLQERLGDWDMLAASLGLEPADQGRGRKAYLRLRERGEALFLQERKQQKAEKAMTKKRRDQTNEALHLSGKTMNYTTVSAGYDFPRLK